MILKGRLYRIMTEDLNRQAVLSEVSKSFEGFTVREALGYWRGTPEASITIEIITDDKPGVLRVAEAIRVLNHQESVLVDCVKDDAELVGM